VITVRIDDGFLNGFPRANAHGIVLRDDQINAQPLGGSQMEPRANTLVGAFLGPAAPQAGDMDVGREQFLKSGVTIPRNGTDRRSLNEEHGAAPGKQSGDLPGLNPANFHLIGG